MTLRHSIIVGRMVAEIFDGFAASMVGVSIGRFVTGIVERPFGTLFVGVVSAAYYPDEPCDGV